MKYDFNAPIDRSDNFSAKHDELMRVFGKEDIIPLWIADMDMPAAQPIVDAIEKRNQQKIYGYTSRPASYFDSICKWQKDRHGWEIDQTMIRFGLGVVPVLNTIIRECSKEGDKVLFFTPVYSEFFDVVSAWGRVPITSQLKEIDGKHSIDFKDLEQKLGESPKFLILCNPHNPVGRVWSKEELNQIGLLCMNYGVAVISDEIHSDLMLWDNKHTPFVCANEKFKDITISCISATKTFNLAGMQASTVVFPNNQLMKSYDDFWNGMDVHRNNCFSAVATEAAFTYGHEWLEQALKHFEANSVYIQNYLKENIPEIKTNLPQATYLMWLDCRELGLNDQELADFMINKAKLGLSRGITFGKGGEGHMRLNIACPIGVLEQAMKQLHLAVSELKK